MEKSINQLTGIKKGLIKTRKHLTSQINNLFYKFKPLDKEIWENLEEILIKADVGVEATMKLVENLKERAKKEHITKASDLIDMLKQEILQILKENTSPLNIRENDLTILLIVGVNGSGKTTTIAKIAHHYKNLGKKAMLAAADTFRAAAIEQLDEWAKKVGVDLVHHQRQSDSGAVVFDAINAAKARGADLLIIDTAGRLHTKINLMKELKKIERVIEKNTGRSSDEILLVLDATTGQNGLIQAKEFNEAIGLTGIILAKLDGTAKGGIILAISQELKIPLKLVGIGENLEDLKLFNAQEFTEAFLEKES